MNDHVLRLQDVTKTYYSGSHEVRAVKDITLALTKATLNAVVGPSGSGKSTLLNLMGALDTPTSGEVYLDGVPLSGLDEKQLTQVRRDRIGFVFQQFRLIPNLSAIENVQLPMEFARHSGDPSRRRAHALLEEVGLGHRADHRPGRLSGGEQQRVAVARALANEPALILADEPTGNLDRASGEDVAALLDRLVTDHGTTVVVITHDEYLAGGAQHRWHLEDGRISEDTARSPQHSQQAQE
jgi:putative ABC transport system ATP-binding protein